MGQMLRGGEEVVVEDEREAEKQGEHEHHRRHDHASEFLEIRIGPGKFEGYHHLSHAIGEGDGRHHAESPWQAVGPLALAHDVHTLHVHQPWIGHEDDQKHQQREPQVGKDKGHIDDTGLEHHFGQATIHLIAVECGQGGEAAAQGPVLYHDAVFLHAHMGHLLAHKGGESGDIETAGEGHRPVALLQREQTGVMPRHGSQGVAVLGIGEGLGKAHRGGAALSQQHHVACTPRCGEQHGLGHITHAVNVKETAVAILLETVLGHSEELYLAVPAHLSVGGITHLLSIARKRGGTVEYHQLPWSVTPMFLLTEEEGAESAVVDKAFSGLLFLKQVAQQHILRVVVPHQPFDLGHGKAHLAVIGHHLDGLAIM